MPKPIKKILQKIRDSRAILTLGDIRFRTWIERFKEKGIYDCGLDDYLKKFSKNGGWQRSASYKIHYNFGHGYRSNGFEVFFDTDYGFILATKDGPPAKNRGAKEQALAAIGFEADIDSKTVLIKQLQGKFNRAEDLKNLRWEKMLVAIVIDWARENGFRRVMIQRAEDNTYYDQKYREADWRQRFKLRYDVTAKRMGFKMDSEAGAYALELV